MPMCMSMRGSGMRGFCVPGRGGGGPPRRESEKVRRPTLELCGMGAGIIFTAEQSERVGWRAEHSERDRVK
jgi:hypothetical protein